MQTVKEYVQEGKTVFDEVKHYPARLLKIERPLEIPQVIFELQRRWKTNKQPGIYFLKHEEEPHIVMGRSQALHPDKYGKYKQIKRPDPGRGWLHKDTFCITLQQEARLGPSDAEKRFAALLGYGLHSYAKREDTGLFTLEDRLRFEGSDMYNSQDQQIFGTSTMQRDGGVMHRACTYIQDVTKDKDIEAMLNLGGYTMQEFEQKLHPPLIRFDEYMIKTYKPSVLSARAFVSGESKKEAEKLQLETKGDVQGLCVID